MAAVWRQTTGHSGQGRRLPQAGNKGEEASWQSQWRSLKEQRRLEREWPSSFIHQ